MIYKFPEDQELYLDQGRCKICSSQERKFIEALRYILGKTFKEIRDFIHDRYRCDIKSLSLMALSSHFKKHSNLSGFLKSSESWQKVYETRDELLKEGND